ncbi:carbohydrate ABC transporter permease [Streptomyces sp. NPDC056002]|uniref:carbohydrate ABC transporter permease n=1 Tax=unclassified Streptomyces TaxID=2593676 RepID=UPI0035DB3513
MVLSSLRTTREIFASPWSLPTRVELSNYVTAFDSGFGRAALNSVLVSSTAAVISVALAAPAAYVLSRRLSGAAGPLTVLFVLGLGVPGQVLLIPVFKMLSRIGLVDSLVGLGFAYVALSMPFTVFLLTGFFRSLPQEVEEAAALDGASPGRRSDGEAMATFADSATPAPRSHPGTAPGTLWC